ncbi:MAG: phosphoglycerate dehydrogenase, partial [Brevundimonas sp.]|nr:phosphoglycerate dehydrogenase [Brevundimonas sp.]
MADPATFVFDFDSTLVDFETLELLADIALEGSPEADAVRAKIARLTDRAMTGDLPFGEALTRRLALLPLTRDHLERLAVGAEARLTASVRRNLDFFRERAGRIVI